MEKNIRVMTAVSPELNEKLMALCKAYGTTKSSLVAYYVGKAVDMETRVQGLVTQDTLTSLMTSLVKRGDIPQITLPNGNIYDRETDK